MALYAFKQYTVFVGLACLAVCCCGVLVVRVLLVESADCV